MEEVGNRKDTGLNCLVAIARFHRLPAEPEQLSHQFGIQGQPFTDTEILLSAKALTLKAKVLTYLAVSVSASPLRVRSLPISVF